ILGLGNFQRRDFDDHVVDAEPDQRAQHVLHGVDLDLAALQDGATAVIRVVVGVLRADLNARLSRKIGADDDDAAVGRSRTERDLAAGAGVDADPGIAGRDRDRALVAAGLGFARGSLRLNRRFGRDGHSVPPRALAVAARAGTGARPAAAASW